VDQAAVDQYRALGFVLVPGLVPDLDELRWEADALVQPEHDDKTWGGDWRDAYGAAGAAFKLWARQGIHADSAAWGRLVTDSPVVDAARALIGPGAHLHQTTAVYKPAVVGQAFPLHQDVAYYGDGFRDYTIAVVHLDDTPSAMGPLRFFPGAHTRGRLVEQGTHKGYLSPEKYPRHDTIEVCAQAGDVAFFSLFTPHCSDPNTTARVRRTVRCGFCVES
jgi:hypothetical protein